MHILLWLKNAPIYDGNNNNLCCAFIDRFITVDSKNDFINLQKHKHTITCKKKKNEDCRFNIPYPILNKTVILSPLDNTFDDTDIKDLKALYKKIKTELNSIKDQILTLDEFLNKLNITEGFKAFKAFFSNS